MAKKLIDWKEKYSVFYDEIDEQHKKLVDMINELYDSFTQGKADDVVEDILIKMIKYTDYHFKTEEKYFEKYTYSNTEEHIKEHKKFVSDVTDFYKDFKNGSISLSYDIMTFLRNWLLEHIYGSDKKYALEFKKKNIDKL